MKHPKELKIEDYRYDLPDERIAKYPLEERDASKLLIYQDGDISEDIYRNIAAHIPERSLLVFNQTKVVHARLLFQKATGGIIEVFCLEPDAKYADVQTAMLEKSSVWWKCMIGGASKWKHGQVLAQNFPDHGLVLNAVIVARETGSYTLEMSWNDETMTFAEILHIAGKVPLPPYLNREVEAGDEQRYQTIYAKHEGSVAAPTAGLHFTDAVMRSLKYKGVDIDFVTLHVGAGTFKPVKSESMEGHEMHAEWIEIKRENIDELINHLHEKIIAVGTTSLRTLESLYWIGAKLLKGLPTDLSQIAVQQWDPYEIDTVADAHEALTAVKHYMDEQGLQKLVTRTQIIITPGYKFRIVKGLVTNFHQPGSTLLLLVAALIGDDWHRVYDHAMQYGYRFLSYGDGSLLWAKET